MSAVFVAVLLGLVDVATVIFFCWLQWRTVKRLRATTEVLVNTQRREADTRERLTDEVDTTRNDRDYWQDIASAHFVTLQEIAQYMTRRPPRRRWLAIARRVARDATRTPQTVRR